MLPARATLPPQPRALRIARGVVGGALLLLIAVAAWAFLYTPLGADLRHRPQDVGAAARAWVEENRPAAIVAFVGVYAAITVLMLPVWWLQIVGGFAFGIVLGTFLSVGGAVGASLIAVSLARWIAADLRGTPGESPLPRHLARLRRLDQKLGHNGLLVVMALRLFPVIPFSVANYLLGITRVRRRDIALGTALGTPPHVALTVILGARPQLMADWRFWLAFATACVLLSLPVVVRYRKPAWFGKHRGGQAGESRADGPG